MKLKDLTLTQQAYPSDSGLTYQAHAVDNDANEYIVYWLADLTINNGDECCDWDNPVSIKRLN